MSMLTTFCTPTCSMPGAPSSTAPHRVGLAPPPYWSLPFWLTFDASAHASVGFFYALPVGLGPRDLIVRPHSRRPACPLRPLFPLDPDDSGVDFGVTLAVAPSPSLRWSPSSRCCGSG